MRGRFLPLLLEIFTVAQNADNVIQYSVGGQFTATVAAATAGVASAVPGRLCKLVVNSVGTAVTPIHDHASAASGTVLYTLKASPAIGDIIVIDMPAANGIYIAGGTNTSAITVSYNKTGTNGNA